MQTLQTNHPLARRFDAQVNHPNQTRPIPLEEKSGMKTATHDFLVLNTCPDLSPELPAATLRFAPR